MNSLRERIETIFAAAAFAERNLDQDARELLKQTVRTQPTRRDNKSQRPRLNA